MLLTTAGAPVCPILLEHLLLEMRLVDMRTMVARQTCFSYIDDKMRRNVEHGREVRTHQAVLVTTAMSLSLLPMKDTHADLGFRIAYSR